MTVDVDVKTFGGERAGMTLLPDVRGARRRIFVPVGCPIYTDNIFLHC